VVFEDKYANLIIRVLVQFLANGQHFSGWQRSELCVNMAHADNTNTRVQENSWKTCNLLRALPVLVSPHHIPYCSLFFPWYGLEWNPTWIPWGKKTLLVILKTLNISVSTVQPAMNGLVAPQKCCLCQVGGGGAVNSFGVLQMVSFCFIYQRYSFLEREGFLKEII